MFGKPKSQFRVTITVVALILPLFVLLSERPFRVLSIKTSSVTLKAPDSVAEAPVPDHWDDALVEAADVDLKSADLKEEIDNAEGGTESRVERAVESKQDGTPAVADRETESNSQNDTKEVSLGAAEAETEDVIERKQGEETKAEPESKTEHESEDEREGNMEENPEGKPEQQLSEGQPEEQEEENAGARPEDEPETQFEGHLMQQEPGQLPNQDTMTETVVETEVKLENLPKEETKTQSPEQPLNQTSAQPIQQAETPEEKSTTQTDEQQPEEKADEDPAKLEATELQPSQSDAERKDSSQDGIEDSTLPRPERQAEDVATELPPRLAPSLVHIQRPSNLTEPYDWKRPAMLTALGIPEGDMLKLAVVSTGVDLIGFRRSFHFLGCLVGNKTYPRMVSDQRTPHFCLVDPEIPNGAHISILLRRDEAMAKALEAPFVFHEFTIENSEDDFLKLGDEVEIHDKVRNLTGEYEIVTIKSSVKWHEGLREPVFNPEKKRFELCLMTAMRQYPFLMQQWFDYYRRVGVDQIYVYDNVATEDLSQFESDFVQTAFWPFGRSQQQSFNHFLLLARNRCKYVGFLDADEYVFIGESGPEAMKQYVRKRMNEGYDQVIFPFIVMAGSGYVERPEGFLPELYVRRNLRQNKFHVGKSVLLSEARWIRHGVHAANGGKKTYKNSTFELNPTSFDHNGMLMHYTKRSWEEFIMKQNAGGASIVTNARAPQNMTMQSIPNYYLSNDSTAEFLTFRDRWRNIMKLVEPRDFTLTWRSDNKECTQQYCIACNGTAVGETTCNQIGN